ncbi:MAG: EAL domain-containing protein [Pseudazoarcus pumilus]|nr:EAL domain-containing protein [Pseudazoarcus pumilus]
MSSTLSRLTVLAAAVLAAAAPLFVTLDLARDLALEDTQTESLRLAREVLNRSDTAASQLYAGIDQLSAFPHGTACDSAHMDAMRTVVASMGQLRAIGLMRGNHMPCSSWGDHGEGLDFGPAEFTTPTGSVIRTAVSLSFAPGEVFTTVERKGYAAVIHKSQPVDIVTDLRGVGLATFTPGTSELRSVRGPVQAAWIDRLGDQRELLFRDGEQLVAMLRSPRYQTGVIAAVPMSHYQQQMGVYMLRLIPAGLVAGAILLLAFLYLNRLQQSWPATLRTALRRNEFSVVYQPVVSLQDGRVIGAETLIRWQRRNGEHIRPDVFIAAAEDAGVVHLLTQRVCDLVERDVRQWLPRFPGLCISINLSANDLHRPETVDMLRRLAGSVPERSGWLTAEVTERGFMRPEEAIRVVEALRADGIGLAIDDFGTGYSSLAYLQHLRFDCLKIDRSFVHTLGTAAPTSQVVFHIIELARSLGLKMVAEGVETEAQAQTLRELGVEAAQGWLFGKPMSAQDLTALLERGPVGTCRD